MHLPKPIKCLLALAAGFASMGAALLPGFVYRGDLDFVSPTYNDHFAGALIYEAVRSHQVAPVQWNWIWDEGFTDGTTITHNFTFELFASDDFAACASFAPFSRATASHPDTKRPMLLAQDLFDHELVRGHCVAMRPIARPTAKATVQRWNMEGLSLTEGNGDTFTAKDRYEILSRLGIDAGPSGHDLWSRDGNARAIDEVTDADLVRAIKSGDAMRNAALGVLRNRRKGWGGLKGCGLLSMPPAKSAGPSVATAILDTGILAHSPGRTRRLTMLALASIELTADHPRLASQLISGLEQPMEDNRPPAEIARQRRVAALAGDDFAATPDGRPMFQTYYEFENAAAVAVIAGDDVDKALADHFASDLKQRVLRSTAEQPCADMMIAHASYADGLIMDLIHQTEKYMLPIFQNRIQAMAAIAVKNSSTFRQAMLARCGRPEGFLPNGSRALADAFCQDLGK